MDPRTMSFLRRAFWEYYQGHPMDPPERLSRREFARINLGESFMKRHMAARSTEDMRGLFTGTTFDAQVSPVPGHVYYSSAYYERPGAPTMAEKGWKGADLIFDLDADHLKGADELTYKNQLEQVKVMVRKLIDDFLVRDFGFDEKCMDLVFSGGRGYHVHVSDPRVLTLDSHARREIVDYITGTGLDIDLLMTERLIGYQNPGTRWATPVFTYEIPDENEPGWRGRFTRGVVELARKLSAMDEKSAVKYLMRYKGTKEHPGMGRQSAATIYRDVKERLDIIAQGKIDFFENERLRKLFVEVIQAEAQVLVEGETDEPVTTDVKRLIRLPSSLHGKTGLRVTRIPLQELDKFDPLTDALAFDDRPIKVKGARAGVIPLGHQVIEIHDGEESVVPMFAAVFGAERGILNII